MIWHPKDRYARLFTSRSTASVRVSVVLLVLLFVTLLLPIGFGRWVVVGAADNVTTTPGAPTPTQPTAQSTTVPSGPEDILAQAQAALNQANAVSTLASQVSSQANNASSQASTVIGWAGIVIGFIQVLAIVGGVAAALGGYFFAVRGLRTLSDYQSDLAKAREELDIMRAQLTEATEDALNARRGLEADSVKQLTQVREQAAKAYQAFSSIQIGQQQFDIGNTQAAQQMYEEAYELNPDSQIVNYLLGELYVIERDLPRAVTYLERAMKMAPNFAPTYAALGLARRLQADKLTDSLQRSQLYAEAEQLLLKAIQLNPGVRDAHKESGYSTLGGLYRRQGRIPDSLAAYTKAEAITPNNSYPVVNLAQLHFLQGDADQAQSYFQRALAISQRTLDSNPSDPWARLDVITAELALDDNGPAFQQLNVALKQKQTLGSLETLLSGFVMLKNAPRPPSQIDQAIALVETAIEDIKKAQ